MKKGFMTLVVIFLLSAVVPVVAQEPTGTPNPSRTELVLVTEDGDSNYWLSSSLVYTKNNIGLPSGTDNLHALYEPFTIPLEPLNLFFIQETEHSWVVFIDAGWYFFAQPDFASLPYWEGTMTVIDLNGELVHSGLTTAYTFVDTMLEIAVPESPILEDANKKFDGQYPLVELEPTAFADNGIQMYTAPYFCWIVDTRPDRCSYRSISFDQSAVEAIAGWGNRFYLLVNSASYSVDGAAVDLPELLIPISGELDADNCFYTGPMYGVEGVYYFGQKGHPLLAAETCTAELQIQFESLPYDIVPPTPTPESIE